MVGPDQNMTPPWSFTSTYIHNWHPALRLDDSQRHRRPSHVHIYSHQTYTDTYTYLTHPWRTTAPLLAAHTLEPTTGVRVIPGKGSVIQHDLNHRGGGGAKDRSEEMTHRTDKSTVAVFAVTSSTQARK